MSYRALAMGRSSLSLFATAVLIPLVVGGGEGGGEITKWYTTTCWSTEKQEKSVTFTEWSTTIVFVDKPTTTTVFVDKPTTTTVYVDKPTTVYSTLVSDRLVPTTEPVYITSKETEIQVSGHTETQIATETAAVTSVSVVVTTVYETITPKVETIPPVTVTACPTTPSPILEGLVLCPSRTANPIPKSFPPDYTWGCPPGKVCKPKQINCNFEQNLPEDGFYCEEEECIAVPFLPPWDNYDGPWTNYSCRNLLDVVPGYFYFDPHLFGLDFDIYDFGGQVAKSCETPAPPPPPASPSKSYSAIPIYSPSKWQPWTPPSPTPEVSSEWQPWSPPAETSRPSSSPPETEWQGWDVSSPASVSNTWGDWESTSGAWAQVTPRAVLEKRDNVVPPICEDPCQQCVLKAQHTGKVRRAICPPDSPFSKALDSCRRCIENNKDDAPKAIPPLLQTLRQWIDYCKSPATTVDFTPSGSPAAPITETTMETTIVTMTTAPETLTTESPPTVSSSTSLISSPTFVPPESTTSPTSVTPPAGSVTLITSCNCVTITSTLASASPPVTQLSDGQPQAPTGPATFTGGVSSVRPAESNWFLTLLLSILALFQM